MIVDEMRKLAAEYNLFGSRMQKILGLIQEAAKRGKYCIILRGSTEDEKIHNKDIFGEVTINTWSILLEKPTMIKRFSYFSYPELLALKENGFHIVQKMDTWSRYKNCPEDPDYMTEDGTGLYVEYIISWDPKDEAKIVEKNTDYWAYIRSTGTYIPYK